MKLPRALSGCTAVIDTMCFMYLFEDRKPYAEICEFLIDQMARGRFTGLITPITTAELIVKPLRERRPDIADTYRHAVESLLQTNLRLAEISTDCGWMAGSLRAKYRHPLPDMMQIAVAMDYPRPAIITEDKALKKVGEIDVVLLSEIQS